MAATLPIRDWPAGAPIREDHLPRNTVPLGCEERQAVLRAPLRIVNQQRA